MCFITFSAYKNIRHNALFITAWLSYNEKDLIWISVMSHSTGLESHDLDLSVLTWDLNAKTLWKQWLCASKCMCSSCVCTQCVFHGRREQKDPVYLRDKVSQKHSKEQFESAQRIEQDYSKYFTGLRRTRMHLHGDARVTTTCWCVIVLLLFWCRCRPGRQSVQHVLSDHGRGGAGAEQSPVDSWRKHVKSPRDR